MKPEKHRDTALKKIKSQGTAKITAKIRSAVLVVSATLIWGQGGGNALEFDGVNDYVSIPSSSVFKLNTFTIEAWGKFSDVGTALKIHVVFDGARDLGSNGYNLTIQDWNSNQSYRAAMQVGSTTCASPQPGLSFDTWYHIACTFDGSTEKIFVNGVEKTAQAKSGITNYDTVRRIGGQVKSYRRSERYLSGSIDEIRVWNTARTQSQLQVNMFKQIDGGTSGLVGYWRFNESAGTSAADQTANSNTGTLTNMTEGDWVTSTTPIASSKTSGKTDITAIWPSNNSNASSILTITDSDIAGTNCLIFGHDNGALTANTSGVPGTINRRLNAFYRTFWT